MASFMKLNSQRPGGVLRTRMAKTNWSAVPQRIVRQLTLRRCLQNSHPINIRMTVPNRLTICCMFILYVSRLRAGGWSWLWCAYRRGESAAWTR